MHSFFKKLVLSLMSLALLPVFAFAYDIDPNMGIVYINVENHLGEQISGEWYLHRAGLAGNIIRNGTKSYDFQTDDGNYYIEVRKVNNYEAFEITSENPLTLNKGESVTFDVVYYPDQEYMDAVLAGEITPEPVDEPVITPTPIPEPEPTVSIPAPVATPVQTSGPITVTVVPDSNSAPVITPYVPDFNQTPLPYVPDFNQAPVASDEIDTEMDLGAITTLAETGPVSLLLLFPSMFGGLYFASKKRK